MINTKGPNTPILTYAELAGWAAWLLQNANLDWSAELRKHYEQASANRQAAVADSEGKKAIASASETQYFAAVDVVQGIADQLTAESTL